MEFYDFIYRDSLIHRLDPRTKILWLIILTFSIFLNKNPIITISIFAFIVLTIFLSKLPIGVIWKSTRIFVIGFTLAYIILFSLLLWNFNEGISGGIIFSINFIIIILSTIIFTMSTSPRDIITSLTKLKVPYDFAFMLTLAVRFVPVTIKEFNHVIKAQQARAHKFRYSLLHPIKTIESFVPVLIPTLMILFKKAVDLSMSIESRAFRTSSERTYSPQLRLRTKDYISFVVLIILLALVINF